MNDLLALFTAFLLKADIYANAKAKRPLRGRATNTTNSSRSPDGAYRSNELPPPKTSCSGVRTRRPDAAVTNAKFSREISRSEESLRGVLREVQGEAIRSLYNHCASTKSWRSKSEWARGAGNPVEHALRQEAVPRSKSDCMFHERKKRDPSNDRAEPLNSFRVSRAR